MSLSLQLFFLFVWISVLMSVQMHTCVGKDKRTASAVIFQVWHSSALFSWDRTSPWSRAGHRGPGICLPPPSWPWDSRLSAMLGFLHELWGLNSGLWAHRYFIAWDISAAQSFFICRFQTSGQFLNVSIKCVQVLDGLFRWFTFTLLSWNNMSLHYTQSWLTSGVCERFAIW